MEAKNELEVVTEKVMKIVDDISSLNVLEIVQLVKILEKKFGVSASSVYVPAAGVAPAGQPVEKKEEEQKSFSVILKEVGPNKLQVIKEIRAIMNLDLKSAKEFVESAPKAIKEDVSQEEANKIKNQIEKVGAKVEIK